ncbi:DUF6572 domain-containing protein [Dyella mobilis]|uniref:Uncharacterized protein n=1 Tax=Dyella mobilis TaxID=1849582 RepID=A0ABS2KFF0_9GAMM|nr:DUF6572 domain-containing protein [Dyella mobilis]MBM7129885.1 hypothetical protein [Dyella mobilis]GLQ97850.1 hypothetical protein GCM10007863_22700 [Dyella mobilis]
MSIEQLDVVDVTSVDSEGVVVLTISDHLAWENVDAPRHLWLLQEKINKYLAFFESGEIYESCPQYRGMPAKISVVGKHPLSGDAQAFYTKVSSIVEGAGFGFEFKHFDVSSSR